jgi:hypothetical protein
MQGSGYLAIWSDLAPEDETDWAHWMTREHAAERVGIDGFLACRIWRAAGATVNRYLILYELETPDVVGSPAYLARLNAPSAWSQRMMPRLRNFVRGGGRVAASAGLGQGGVLAAVPLDAKPDWGAAAVCRELAGLDRIAAARVLLTDAAQTSIQTREKGMRDRDESFAGLLLIEALDQMSLRDALWRVQLLVPQLDARRIEQQRVYRMMFNLHRRLLPG